MPRPRKGPRPEIARKDAELAEAAKRKAGGPAGLARVFGVTPQAASEWGRTRSIPRHVRPRLEEYVELRTRGRVEPVDELLETHTELQRHLRDLFQPDVATDVEKLPPKYRGRYRDRLQEIQSRIVVMLGEMAASVDRELIDFRARLIAEYRAERRRPR